MRAAELMVYKAAEMFDGGINCGAEANMAKLLAADASWAAAEACVHDVFYADLFLWIDFGSELTDLHMGPWEHTPPRRLKPRRGPIPLRGALSPIGHCALTLLLSLPYRPLLPEHTS